MPCSQCQEMFTDTFLHLQVSVSVSREKMQWVRFVQVLVLYTTMFFFVDVVSNIIKYL